MTTQDSKRKLTAILSADVKGYSRLMSQDEEATVKTLKQHRETISGIVSEHRGRVVDSPGDNILAEFGSVVDAVKCAVKIQESLKWKNAELPENRRMEFRIGVNLGDVIEEDDRIYGDGVNIAARLEGLAEPGGICVSGTAFDHVKNKLSVGYQYLGKQTVKNIPDPVRAYKVLMEPEAAGKVIGEKEPKQRRWAWRAVAVAVLVLVAGGLVWNFYWRAPKIEPASKERMAFPLPERPSIAVLAFTNISGDPKDDLFGDGLAEGIINGLSKFEHIFVIARNSSFTYKGKPVKVKQVAEEMGVRYVIEGSLQREGERARITVQLIDAVTGHHLFSERYDRDLKGILNLQDEITMKVLTAVRVKLTAGEGARIYEKGTKNLDAYLKVLQAAEHKGGTMNKERVERAMQLLKEAIVLDPEYANAYYVLCTAHFDLVVIGASDSPKESLQRAIELGKKAIALDESNSSAHAGLAFPYMYLREFDKAISEAEKAISLSPNSAVAYFALGAALANAGRPQEAIPMLQKSLRLSPIPVHSQILGILASSYLWLSQYEEATATYKKVLQFYGPDHLLAHLGLAAAYVWTDREKEARAEGAEVMRIDPKFSLERFLKASPYDQSRKDRLADALRKAGLPDKPPLPLPDKPSIAVLPFTNMSDDPKQEFFADGLAEEIINGLTKVPQVFVIARNSSFTYKGKNVDVKQVGREMGVKYVLEGSVRREGDRVRITTQLVDAMSGNHIFSERYDRDLKDIFALQDEITMKVLTAMRVKWAYGEHERAMAKGTKNLEAYLKVMQGWEYCQTVNKESQALARQLAEEAIALDRGYAQAYRLLAQAIAYEALVGSYQNREEALSRAMEMAQKAVSLDDSLAGAHATLGYVALMFNRDYGKAIAEAERAVALEPNSAEAYFSLGSYLFWAGRFEEGIAHLRKALSFTPIEPARYLNLLAHCYAAVGQLEEAISIYRKIIQFQPNHRNAHLGLVCAYVLSGREEEARNQTKEILRIDPKFTIQEYVDTAGLLYKDQDFAEKFRYEPLRKAGLK